MRVKITLDVDIIERLKELAEKEKTKEPVVKGNNSFSAYINRILKKHVKKNN